MATTTEQIIRCLKSDMGGDLLAGARYAEEIARNAALNPWAQAGDADYYSDAARRLRDEHARSQVVSYDEDHQPTPIFR